VTAGREKVLFLGPLPPPFMGPTLATDIILSSKLGDDFDLVHIDTSDHRDLRRLAALDATNFLLAFLHYGRLLARLLAGGARLVYIPVSQTTIGFLRDAVFILLARLFRRPVICHLRGGRFDLWMEGASSLTRFIVRRVLGSIQGMIVLGRSIAGQFDGWVAPQRLHIVPNGADYPPPPDRQVQGGELRILYVGNLQTGKGIVDVVKAAAGLGRRGVSFRLDAVGSWRDEEARDECFRICADGYTRAGIIAGHHFDRTLKSLGTIVE
jgi:glycosyltransferase involved in cell wall biosynthesis